MISYEKCKKVLTAIWMTGFLIPFGILSLQTIKGSFWGGKESEAWALFTPMILPTIGLIIGVLIADANNPVVEDREVKRTIFYVTVALSVLYLGLVIAIFGALPTMAANATDVTATVTDATGKDAAKATSGLLDAFKRSGLMLGAIQGLVTTTLGVFFINKTPKTAAPGGGGDAAKGVAGANKPADTAKDKASLGNKQPDGTETPDQ
jgi:hypothetical protein